jgi:RNA polymerase sigma-70 factor (ECF subfamily)
MDPLKTKELYEKYGFLIYGRCIRILGSKEDAQDAMHDIFLKMVEKYDSFNNREHIVPWIYTVSKNHCLNVLRKNRKVVVFSEETVTGGEKSAETVVGKREVIDYIMKNHNKKVQDAVYYTYIEELDQKEIQKVAGQSPATVRRNLKRFKESIPHIMKRLQA